MILLNAIDLVPDILGFFYRILQSKHEQMGVIRLSVVLIGCSYTD